MDEPINNGNDYQNNTMKKELLLNKQNNTAYTMSIVKLIVK